MSNKENPREVQASLGKKYITEKRSFRQGGDLIRRVIDRGFRLLSTAGVVLSPFLPLDAPTNVSAQSQSPSSSKELGYTPLFPHGEMVKYTHDDHDLGQGDDLQTQSIDLPKLDPSTFVTYSGGGFTATRIHGDGALTDLSYIIAGQGYNDPQLLDSAQLYAQNLLSIESFKSRADKLSIFVLHMQNTPDLGISWNTNSVTDVLGDHQKVQKLIDALHLSLGSFQEARVLVYDLARYAAAAYADPSTTTLYSYAAFTEARLRGPFPVKGVIAHEEGHAIGGAGEGYYSTNNFGNEPNIYYNCLTADQIPIRWKGIPGAPTGPSPEIEGCGNTRIGAFRDAIRDVMTYSGTENPTYGPVTSWNLNHRLDGAPAIYYAPTLTGPANGVVTNGLGVNLSWRPPVGVEQYQVQVVPFNNDGPGINLIIGDPAQVQTGTFGVLPPKMGEGNYTMLPGQTYTWRVRVTSSKNPVSENVPAWGPWSESNFKTPDSSSSTIKLPITLSSTEPISTPFKWVDDNRSNFYYEVQVSGDNRFDTNPDSATSFVWWNLVHGGITNNSWVPPTSLEPNATYFWRVRPRQQGDAKQLEWGKTWAVRVGADGLSYNVSEVKTDANGNQSFVTAYEYKAPRTQTKDSEVGQVNISNKENDCIRDFIGGPIRGIDDLVDPFCNIRLMDTAPVTLKPGDIEVFGPGKEPVALNREQRRRQAVETRKTTKRIAA